MDARGSGLTRREAHLLEQRARDAFGSMLKVVAGICDEWRGGGELWHRCDCNNGREIVVAGRPSRCLQEVEERMINQWWNEGAKWRRSRAPGGDSPDDCNKDDSRHQGQVRGDYVVRKVVRRVPCGFDVLHICHPLQQCDLMKLRQVQLSAPRQWHRKYGWVRSTIESVGVDIEDLGHGSGLEVELELGALTMLPHLESLDIQRRCFGCEHDVHDTFRNFSAHTGVGGGGGGGGGGERGAPGSRRHDPFVLFAAQAACKVGVSFTLRPWLSLRPLMYVVFDRSTLHVLPLAFLRTFIHSGSISCCRFSIFSCV